MLILTTLLITTYVSCTLATFGVGYSYCRKPGTFNATNTLTITTFNRVGVNQAINALCGAWTDSALRSDVQSCDIANKPGGGKQILAIVKRGSNLYECRANINNLNQCRNPGSGGWGWKRQAEKIDCSTRTDYNDCHRGCAPSDAGINECECYWESLSQGQGFPQDTGGVTGECPDETPCCWNPPCAKFDTIDECFFGSGGTDVDLGDSKCVYDTTAGECVCRTPLEPVPIPQPDPGPIYPPFDCYCAYGNDNMTSAADCAALITPTAEQIRDIRQISLLVALVSTKYAAKAYISSCARDKVRIIFSVGRSILSIVHKLNKQLTGRGVPHVVQYSRSYVDFFFYPGQGSRFRTLAEEELSSEELEALNPINVEEENDPHAMATSVGAVSAFAIAAAAAGAI